MRITVVGVLAIVAAFVAVVLLLRYFESKSDPGPTQTRPLQIDAEGAEQ